MATNHHHHRNHRPDRISVPPASISTTTLAPTPSTSRSSHLHRSPTHTPTASPSNRRLSHSLSSLSSGTATPRSLSTSSVASRTSSFSYLFILLFSLRSLYSLLPFIRSSDPSFLFPFCFLVSLLSCLLSLLFFNFPILRQKRTRQLDLASVSIDGSQLRILLAKSVLLAVVFLLRFQALRYCSTAALILAELSGNAAFRFAATTVRNDQNRARSSSEVRGLLFLLTGLFLLSLSWDRRDCFPFSSTNIQKLGSSLIVGENCARIGSMALPFLSGFLSCFETELTNRGNFRQMGLRRVQLITLFLTTVVLFVPAVVAMWVYEEDWAVGISLDSLGWPLTNIALFGVLLNEWSSDEKSFRDYEKEFLLTFVFTVVLELIYFPELSLWGLLICGLLLWMAVCHLNDNYSNYIELGLDPPESLSSLLMKPVRHCLSERKSRKIALFLMINTGYMFVEFIAGFMSNSLGLISDACHMLFDCAALAIGLYASYISRLPANSQYNFGRGRFEVLSGYANAVFLVLVGALIVLESIERILDPQEVSTSSLLVVSVGGLLVNVVGLVFFHEEHHHAHGGGGCSHSHSHHEHGSHNAGHDHSIDCHHHKHDEHSEDGHHDGKHAHANDNDNDNHKHDFYSHDHHHHGHHDDHNDQCDHHHGHHDDHDDQCDHQHHDHDKVSHVNRLDVHDATSANHSCHDDHSKQEFLPKQELHTHFHIDHNMEGIFLHVLADTLGSVGVVISTLLIKYKGWVIADPACSIFISVLIISSVIPLLRNSAEILLQRVPRAHEADLFQALNAVTMLKGVCGVQNVHVWNLTNTDIVGTLHLHVSADSDRNSTREMASDILKNAGIKDLTLQIESIEK